MRNLFLGLLLVGLFSCTEKSVEVRLGNEREIYPDMIGLNGNLTELDQPWSNDSLVASVREIGVGNFRYPGGTIGNYWDWDRGWIDKSVPDSLMIKWVVTHGIAASDKRYTLENLAEGHKKLDFTPVFVLNMLSKGLDHTIRNLLKAQDLGLPIKYIELGNELYFNLPFERSVYPTPELYGSTCAMWIDSLKTYFPEAKYAIIATYLKRNKRHTDWTQRALAHCNNADAITFHKYSPAGIDGGHEKANITAGTEGMSDASTAIRKNPFSGPIERQKWEIELLRNDSAYANFLYSATESAESYDKLGAPEGTEIWATEFNMRDDESALRGTWANTLYTSKYYDAFLEGPITITNIHNAIGYLFPQIFSDTSQLDHVKWKEVKSVPWALSSQGIATSIFAKSSRGMTKAVQLNFSDERIIVDDRGNQVNTLSGWIFSNDKETKVLLINYGRESVSLDLSGISGVNDGIQYYSTPENYITKGWQDLKTEKVVLSKTTKLPSFSFTILN